MNYYTMKERLGVLPSYLRCSSTSPLPNYKDLVTQSFVDEFDAQSLSDTSLIPSPLFPLPPSSAADCYSPRASIDSLIPSPIIFDNSNTYSSPSLSSLSSSSLSSSSSSPTFERSERRPLDSIKRERRSKREARERGGHYNSKLLSSSLPLLPGIEPLVFSEETVGFNSSLVMIPPRNLRTPPTTRRKSLLQRWNCAVKAASSNQENRSMKAMPTRTGQRRPLNSLASNHCLTSPLPPLPSLPCAQRREEEKEEGKERGLELHRVQALPRPASSREEREEEEGVLAAGHHHQQHKPLQVEKRAYSDQYLLLAHNKRHRGFKNNCM